MQTYPDSVRFLYALGNELKGIKFGLETMRRLLEELDHPQRACRFVHVAGTNGKGSTCAMIESALRAAGAHTGLYTSPHLVEPTERIQIGGGPVSPEQFAAAFSIVHQAAERLLAQSAIEHHPTYFESLTAMALVLFREHRATDVVLETGMGGRLDATNVVHPRLCVITPIDYDHEKYLGGAIEAIAQEKAGILKAGVSAVMAPQRMEAERVLCAKAQELGCRLIRAADHPPELAVDHPCGNTILWRGLRIECPLAGAHQIDNAVTAALALEQLGVPADAITAGIAATRWPGRLERVRESPEIILDGAHNPAGARALAAHIRRHYRERKLWLIFGAMRDKNVGEIIDALFPLAQELILTAPDSPRALHPETLLALCGHPNARTAPHLRAALEAAKAAPEDVILISGSLFLVGEARTLLVG